MTAVSPNPRIAKDSVRKHVAVSLGRPERAEPMLPGDLIDEKRIHLIQECVRHGEIGQAARLLDERWIDCVAAAGTADGAVDLIERMVANGLRIPAIDTWKGLKKKMGEQSRESCLAAACALTVAAGANFVLYGPIESAEIVFPAIGMVDAAFAQLSIEERQMPNPTHPIFKIA
jgi:tetrahydromethanopterin S-methyltransferase subunit H